MAANMPDLRPSVVPTTHNRFFWAGAVEGRLLIQRCDHCGRYQHPPMPLCASCHSRQLSPQAVSGRGRVYAHTIVRRVFHPGFASEVPYVVALIELDEQPGLRLVSNVIGCAPEAVSVGLRVRVDFEPRGDWALPVFRPDAEHGR